MRQSLHSIITAISSRLNTFVQDKRKKNTPGFCFEILLLAASNNVARVRHEVADIDTGDAWGVRTHSDAVRYVPQLCEQ